MGSGVGGAVFDLTELIGFFAGVLIEGRAFFFGEADARGEAAGRFVGVRRTTMN